MWSVLKRMWDDLWILNTILFASCTILFIGRVADRSWWWTALTAAVIVTLIWQGVLGWRSSAQQAEPALHVEDSGGAI
ncbi:hypothetical protein [Mycolicibacterium fortuitum]|uniref:Transmembrane protein n=1 Tax=Mycolicibacterium fortuitum subsp. fortuitum DSM 46621 = ATCC 6841 = JCM 6387 TaxID=1214102 RepID=K0VQW4_MYCFO|nr:hypothetical protein [Mycolicibacterium fortuitum]AIY46961.1 hypothetical protein G155_16895 [Mycobacterium sp. VKM Ac-1817D]EJZ13729.1 hypothetical protein MFORT_13303 [Mycolicibacterium fortuitum subsp. fortuitum DSM 46621 = ATCC 6841 = JCM 6387]WEV30432.1 hypothetical protein OMF10_17120 [Mycolicibacterium fortuitum]CRL55816.1 hypothetical protein CPGR_03124 [Mycolicibacterium fortuitum subsp. fortuitum DSM 46621 = ATCC 6841 = JCM 6387]